ncbi:hypothetical protein Q8A67_014132 [Cirrhinus molitorella]|uniref:Uncharacterized protein n=1 Tax=Cirrhinus molitorella TaxID=172907 RepID=A0AA88PQC3_9TELE|nr:hypothetical protein Q8A67_014132 [Cirrhinus molitorella]
MEIILELFDEDIRVDAEAILEEFDARNDRKMPFKQHPPVTEGLWSDYSTVRRGMEVCVLSQPGDSTMTTILQPANHSPASVAGNGSLGDFQGAGGVEWVDESHHLNLQQDTHCV